MSPIILLVAIPLGVIAFGAWLIFGGAEKEYENYYGEYEELDERQ